MKQRWSLLTLALGLVFFYRTAQASYIGLEPERLTRILATSEGWGATDERLAEIESELASVSDARLWHEKGVALAFRGQWELAEAAFRLAAGEMSEARLGQAVSLSRLGRNEEALEVISSGDEPADSRFATARVLLKLRSEEKIRFSELRKELYPFVSSDLGAFEMWLALNPAKDELEAYLKTDKADETSETVWRRAEVLLRLEEPDKALRELQGLGQVEGALANRADYARARAYFQLESDAAGQSIYEAILGRLDEPTSETLYRDVSAITTSAERTEFRKLDLEDQAAFFRRFWTKRHPVPVREVNPRLGEHYRRLTKALAEYPLQSTGGGYFTDREAFLAHSPELPYYNSASWFERAQDSSHWVDHRGFVLLRHGEPDSQVGPRTFGSSYTSESWLISRARTRPYLFNFVKRPEIGEFVLALNLGLAATRPAAIDTPPAVAEALTRDYGRLYLSRVRLHPIYRSVPEARSRVDLERLLEAESQQMASFANAAMAADSTSYYTRENTLPMAVSASNFYSEGLPGVDVDFAVDLSDLDLEKLDPDSTLEASVLVYDDEWRELLTEVHRKFSLWPPPSGKAKTFVGNIQILDLDPAQYRLALQVSQADTGRVGIARGGHETMYVPADNLGLSDLYLRQLPASDEKERDVKLPVEQGAQWLPVPGRVIRRSVPAKVEFELYNLSADESGTARFEVEERLLTLYEKPGLLSQIAGYGNLAGQIFFPFYTFVAQAGGFALSQALASETKGLEVETRTVERPAQSALKEEVQIDLSDLKPGVYTVYVTVRDSVSTEVVSRFLTLQVT